MANIKDITSGTTQPGDNSIASGTPKKQNIPPAQGPIDLGLDSVEAGIIGNDEISPPSLPTTMETAAGTEAETFDEAFDAMTEYDYSPVERLVYSQAAESDDPEAYIGKWETAKKVAEYYNIPKYDAMANLEMYLDDYWGANSGRDFKTTAKAIADSFSAGAKMIELSFAGNAAYFDDSKLEDVKRIAGEIAQLNYDRIPRSWYVDAAKVFGNVIPYSAYLGGSTFLAGIMTGGLGAAPAAAGAAAGAMNVTKGAAALATAIKVADFAHSAIMLNGSAYADMVTKGVDPKAARLMSPVAGVAGTVVERFIGAGLEGAYKRAGVELGAKLTRKEVSEALTKRIAGKFLTAGGLDTVAKNYIKEAVSTTVGEAAEEGLQAVTDGIAMMFAESISEELGVPVIDTTEAWDIFRDAASSMVTSLYVAPILGAPANLVTAFTTVERAKQINSLARTTDRETYGKIFNELDEVKGLEQSARDELASMTWEKAQSDLITDQTKAREAAKESVPEGQKAPERTERGDIAFSEQIVSEENGKTTVEYTAGPANNPHATVEFDIEDDKLVIVAAEFRDEYRSTADELIQQIASEYPTKEIVLADPDTVDPTIAGAYERAVKMGPTGKASWVSTGDTQQDAEAKQRVRSSLARTGLMGQAQQELAIILMDNMAKGSGKTFSSFASNLEGFNVNEALKESGKVGSLVTVEDAVKEAKYVIELAKNANFAVVVHELGHFARKTLGDSTMLRDLESVYGISDGIWTTEKEEQFTNDLMKYITDGKVKDEKLRGVFQRIADFLARTWRGVLSKAELSESVEQWFDKYFSGEMAQVETTPVQATTVETEIVPPPPGVDIEPFVDANKVIAEVSKEQKTVEDAEVAMGVNEIKEILASVDGANPSDHEDNFKHWFQNSKAVDQNGEPLVLYHGSPMGQFTQFMPGIRARNEPGFFFTPDEKTASYYTSKQDRSKERIAFDWTFSDHQLDADFAMVPESFKSIGDLFRGGDQFITQEQRVERLSHGIEKLKKNIQESHPYAISTEATPYGKPSVAHGEELKAKYLDTLDRALLSLDNVRQSNPSGEGFVHSVYLSIQNPLVVDASDIYAGGFEFRKNMNDWFESAISGGHDGMILKNLLDSGIRGDQYVAFTPSQIKSTENNGQWNKDDTRLLFMSEDEIKRSSATVHEAASQEAADYKTVEEWMEAIGQDYNKLRNDQKKWVNGLFNYAHSDKKVKFKPGEFAKMMDNDKVVEFIADLEKQIYGRQKSQMGRERQKAIADAALKTPTIKRLVDKIHSGETLSVQDLTEAKRYIRGNETIVKFLYARLNSDNDLAFEAASQMKDVYPLARKMLLSRPGITMKEQAEIMLDIKDKSIRDKIKGRTIKVSDLDAFIKAIKVPLVTEKDLKGAKLRDYKQKVAERDAARRLRAAIIKRKRYIMQKVPGSVDLEQRKAIELIQQYAQQAGRGPIDLSKLKALASVVFKRNPKMIEVYVNQVKAISEKPFDEWTFAEVDNLSKLVKRLIDEGKAKRAEQRLAFSIARDEMIQRMMDSISQKKGYQAPLTEGTEEWKKQQKKVNKNYDAINIDRFANKLGLNEKLLFDDTVRYMRDKLSRIDERTSFVNQFIQNQDIEIDGKSMKIFDALHRTVEVDGVIGLKGEKATWTRSLLMGAYLLVGSKDKFNQSQREAFIYGNLFSLQEKQAMSREQSIEFLNERAEKIISVAEATFTDGEKKLMDMMLDNLNLDDAWLRFHDAVYEATGREMVHEKAYFPEVFAGGIKSDDSILEAASGTFGEGVLDLGITYTRARNLKPENRRPLEHDAVRLFFDSVRHQEHISAFAGHLKTVKAVFGGVNSQSYGLRQEIEANYGKNATKYLDEFIDALSKTGDFNKKTAGTDTTSLLRGGVVTAALGFRLSSVLMQLGTSPLPFLQEVNPVELMSSMMSIASSGNPFNAIAESEKKSSILRNRQLDPKKEIERMNDTGFEGWVKRFGTVGMSGIYWADRLTVTAGWNAVYNKKKREGMSDSEAIMYADKVIIRTQPSSEGIYQAPMYRDMDFFKRMFLQFTRPQNVIYQNFRYDMPRAWSEGNHMKAIMIATAYAMSGLIMGLVWVARGRGPEDDEDLMAYYAWAMTSQFTDAIPIAGEVVSQVTRSAFTGERFRPFSGQQLPVLESGAEAVGGVLDMLREGWDEDKAYRVADRAAKAGSYFAGIPYIGPKEIVDLGRAIYNATQE